MASSAEESPIINSDIENDVTSSRRNLVEAEPGKVLLCLFDLRTIRAFLSNFKGQIKSKFAIQ